MNWRRTNNSQESAKFIEKHLEKIKGSKIEKTLLMTSVTTWSHVLIVSRDKKKIGPMIKSLQRVIERYPRSHEAEDALYYLGWIHAYYHPKESLEYFNQYLKKYPKGGNVKSIEHFMEKLK